MSSKLHNIAGTVKKHDRHVVILDDHGMSKHWQPKLGSGAAEIILTKMEAGLAQNREIRKIVKLTLGDTNPLEKKSSIASQSTFCCSCCIHFI